MDPIAPKDNQQQEQAQTQTTQPPGSPIEQLEKTLFRRFMDHKIFYPVIILVIVIFSISIFALLSSKGNENNTQKAGPTATPLTQNDSVKKATQPTPAYQKTQTLVYGTWTSQSSVIRAVELGSQNIVTVATLPLTIKKVSILSKDSLVYIDQTDSNDHGTRISIYNITQK